MPQRRHLLLGLAALPLMTALRPAFAADSGSDAVSTSAGDVTIHPVKHASLVLTFADQAFYFDPADTDFSKANLPPATAIFITHAHGDHFNAEKLPDVAGADAPLFVTAQVYALLPEKLQPRAIQMGNGTGGNFGPIGIHAVPAYNTTPERQQYHPQGMGNGYIVDIGGKNFYIAGDTEDTPEMRSLSGIEVAFLPMNLPYTMDETQAADAVKAFKPKVVYPYHYRGSDPQKFAALVGDAAEVRLRNWYPDGA